MKRECCLGCSWLFAVHAAHLQVRLIRGPWTLSLGTRCCMCFLGAREGSLHIVSSCRDSMHRRWWWHGIWKIHHLLRVQWSDSDDTRTPTVANSIEQLWYHFLVFQMQCQSKNMCYIYVHAYVFKYVHMISYDFIYIYAWCVCLRLYMSIAVPVCK